MNLITLDRTTRLAMFQVRPAVPNAQGGPPLEVVFRASGYRAVARLAGGYLGAGEQSGESVRHERVYGESIKRESMPAETELIPFIPPRRNVIGSACFINRGTRTALLEGTTSILKEPSTTEEGSVSRSALTIDGRHVAGNIGLKFLDSRRQSLLARLGEVFEHVSVLTDRLLPLWLVWLLAVLVVFGVPSAVLVALYFALREDVRAAGS